MALRVLRRIKRRIRASKSTTTRIKKKLTAAYDHIDTAITLIDGILSPERKPKKKIARAIAKLGDLVAKKTPRSLATELKDIVDEIEDAKWNVLEASKLLTTRAMVSRKARERKNVLFSLGLLLEDLAEKLAEKIPEVRKKKTYTAAVKLVKSQLEKTKKELEGAKEIVEKKKKKL